MRRLVPLAVTAALLGAAACLPSELLTVRPTTLADGFTLVRGGGGNSVVLVRAERALVFDSKLWPFADEVSKVVEAAHARTEFLVNSHLHGDHSGGNRRYPGATLVASERTFAFLADDRPSPSLTPFGDSAWLPVKRKTWVAVGGEPVLLGHVGPGHTDSDVYAYFPAERTLATGDMFDHGYYPHVDPLHGGSFLGYVRGLEELCTYDVDLVVPGHGAPATRADLVALRDFLRGLRDEAVSRRGKGESDEAIVAAMSAPRGEPYQDLGPFSSRAAVVKAFVAETRP